MNTRPSILTTTQPPATIRTRLLDAGNSALHIILYTLVLLAGGTFISELVAHAQNADPLPNDPTALLRLAFDAARAGNWRFAVALALIIAVYGVRRALPTVKTITLKLSERPDLPVWQVKLLHALAWFNTDRGGASLSIILGIVGAFGHGLAAHQFSFNLILDGIGMGITAAGGYTIFNRMYAPKDKQNKESEK